MKRSAIAAVAAVLLLTLTGCAGATDAAPSEPQAAAQTVQETSAPLVAEEPAIEADETDAAFVAYVRENLLPTTQIPDATDQQLIDAGHEACTRIADGEPTDTMSLIDSEQQDSGGYFYDSAMIITGARTFLCPA